MLLDGDVLLLLLLQKEDDGAAQLHRHVNPENRAAKKNNAVNPGMAYSFLLALYGLV